MSPPSSPRGRPSPGPLCRSGSHVAAVAAQSPPSSFWPIGWSGGYVAAVAAVAAHTECTT
eukprot:1165715-Pyramimonas_sp.AAC.1